MCASACCLRASASKQEGGSEPKSMFCLNFHAWQEQMKRKPNLAVTFLNQTKEPAVSLEAPVCLNRSQRPWDGDKTPPSWPDTFKAHQLLASYFYLQGTKSSQIKAIPIILLVFFKDGPLQEVYYNFIHTKEKYSVAKTLNSGNLIPYIFNKYIKLFIHVFQVDRWFWCSMLTH